MAKLKDGFYKLTASSIGSDLLVLLAGGGAKPISDFASAFNVKLWGNAFNGSSDVNGTIQFATAGNTGLIKFLNEEFIDGYGNFHLSANSSSWNVFDDTQNYLFTILKSGNVGIGTTEPAFKLDVVGDIKSSETVYGKAVIVVGNTDGPYMPNINWYDLTINEGFHVSYRLNETNKPLRFYYRNSDTFTLLVDINSSGFVGIGTTAPIHKLQVTGAGVFNNTGSTIYTSDGITIGAGDSAARYITCYGKTGPSYINVGYGPGNNNSAEFAFNYVENGSTSNYTIISMYGAANAMYMYPNYTSFKCYIQAPHFYESSDRRLKENIQAILNKDNIPQIKEFDWKSDGSHSYGLIALELEDMGYPELVSNSGSHKTVNYSAALSLIVGKLQIKIKELEKEIEIIKNKN